MTDDPPADPALVEALTDVRRAYRLVHAWQRRVNDLLEPVDAALTARGLAFSHWKPMRYAAPPSRSTTPFFRRGTWAWDMLPGYAVECVWVGGAANGLVRRVQMQVVADSGFLKEGGEPDPLRFTPAEQSSSALYVGLWTARGGTPEWGLAWKAIADRKDRDASDQAATVQGVDYTRRYLGVGIEDLPTLAALRDHVLGPISEWISEGGDSVEQGG